MEAGAEMEAGADGADVRCQMSDARCQSGHSFADCRFPTLNEQQEQRE